MNPVRFVTNQIIQKELQIARIDAADEVCYLHNVVNGAKITIRVEQSFKCGDANFVLREIMDDYIIVEECENFVKDDDEFILNEGIYGPGDLVVTRLDPIKALCYCHSIRTGAKVSFFIGQRLQVHKQIVQLVGVTPQSAMFVIQG